MDDELRERELHEIEAYEDALSGAPFTDEELAIPERIVRRYALPYRKLKLPVDLLFKVIGPLQGRKVLDCGCGDGEFSAIMALLGAHVTGIDISERLIEVARRRSRVNGIEERTEFLCASIHNLPFSADCFDLVFGKGVLHHVDIERASIEVERILKRDGKAVFEEPIAFSPFLRRMRKSRLMRAIVKEERLTPDEEPLTKEDADVLARSFARVELHETQIIARLERILPSQRALRILNALDTKLMGTYPALRKFGRMAIFECMK